MSIIALVIVISCIITILIEFIPVMFMSDRSAWIKASAFCNAVTNPVLNLFMFCVYAFFTGNLFVVVLLCIAAETAVVFVEAYIYKNMIGSSRKTSLIFSLASNLISMTAGSIIMFVIVNVLMSMLSGGEGSHSFADNQLIYPV